MESGGFGPQLSALVGLLGGVYHLSHRKVQSLLDQLLGVQLSTGAIPPSAASQRKPGVAGGGGGGEGRRGDPKGPGAPIGNADGNNPERKRGWLGVLVTPALAVFHLALSRSAEAARDVLG